MTDTKTAMPRCWADGTSALEAIKQPVECQALGTEGLGLCPRHAAEILGSEAPSPPPA